MFKSKEAIESDKMLLKECHEGNAIAQETFDVLSYSNEVLKTVQKVMGQYPYVYRREDIDNFARVCIRQVYRKYEELAKKANLRRAIAEMTFTLATDYVNRRLNRVKS